MDRNLSVLERWSYVGKKDNPRWLWHAIDHHSSKVLAYVFGQRKDEVFLQLKELLEPFEINRFYTDAGLQRDVTKLGSPGGCVAKTF